MIPLEFSSKGQLHGKFYGADGTAASGTKHNRAVGHSTNPSQRAQFKTFMQGMNRPAATYYCANCPYASGTYAVPDGSDRHFCSCADG